jgi:hypothetical protein
MPPTPPKPSNNVNIKREAKAMLTSMKDVERNIARYVSPPDAEGLKLVALQLAMLRRQLGDVAGAVEALSNAR